MIRNQNSTTDSARAHGSEYTLFDQAPDCRVRESKDLGGLGHGADEFYVWTPIALFPYAILVATVLCLLFFGHALSFHIPFNYLFLHVAVQAQQSEHKALRS